MGRRHPSSQPTRYVRVRYLERDGQVATLATFPSARRALAWACGVRPGDTARPWPLFLEGPVGSATRRPL